MCPANTTNLEDGSASCPVPVLPGAALAARYAVVVSFGVYLNGTSLDDIASKVCLSTDLDLELPLLKWCCSAVHWHAQPVE